MKWAIREAVDVYFKARSVFQLGSRTIRAGEPVLIFDTVKTSTFEVAAEIAYVTGGRGNSRILSYEGDKVLTFQFEEALLSSEGLAILSGADLIPARNKHLPGASPDAESVVAHFTEKYAVTRNNRRDPNPTNVFADDESLHGAGGPVLPNYPPRGGVRNVWLTRKPFVGQNASIYVMLLDMAGEMSGAPIEVNLRNPSPTATTSAEDLETMNRTSYLAKFSSGDRFIAFDRNGAPMLLSEFENPTTHLEAGVFDDQVLHYVDYDSCNAPGNWPSAWGAISQYVREISAPNFGEFWGFVAGADSYYSYLLAPSGGVAQPKGYKEGTQLVYQLNVPSILFQDIVLLDYYVEYRHNATQISILPDKFGPYMYVEGSSLVRRASDGMDLPVEFVIPRFKVTTALTFTLASTGDPSTFEFQGDAYPDFSKFDLTRRVLADIQILDADDNYDGAGGWAGAPTDPTSYRRYKYDTTDGEYIWKDPSMQPHGNLNFADTGNYQPEDGGPPTQTPGVGVIDNWPPAGPTPPGGGDNGDG